MGDMIFPADDPDDPPALPGVSDEQVAEWEQEVLLIQMTGACVHCDGQIRRTVHSNGDNPRYARFTCLDCDDQWVMEIDDEFWRYHGRGNKWGVTFA